MVPDMSQVMVPSMSSVAVQPGIGEGSPTEKEDTSRRGVISGGIVSSVGFVTPNKLSRKYYQ